MFEHGDILKRILSELKKRQGSSLDDLLHTLPELYGYMDYNPTYLVFESLVILVKWGLTEAYIEGKLYSPNELEKYDRWDWPKEAIFYISKQAVEMEEALGVRLDAAATQIFGDIGRPFRQWPEVFILMPFAEELRPVYEDHIRTVVSNLHLKVGRADDFFTNGSIMAEIWNAINYATIIIADCTGRNPNVFYEIGISHAIGKQTILITQSMDDIPFDLRHLRVIMYKYDPRGMKEFEKALKKTIQTLQAEEVELGKHP